MAADSLRSAPVPELRDDDHVRGDGPIVLLYADFSCPRCALAWSRLDGRALRVAFRHLALQAKHPRAVALARAAEAAALQGAFWPWADAVYADPGRTDDPHLWALCARLGLDVERWDADRRSEKVLARVTRDVRDALRAGAVATPTLFAGGSVHAGPPEAAWLDALRLESQALPIREALNKAPSRPMTLPPKGTTTYEQ